jgi:hypothetical protein
MGQVVCPETSANNYKPTLRNISEEYKPHLHRSGSLKSRKIQFLFGRFEVFQLVPIIRVNGTN